MNLDEQLISILVKYGDVSEAEVLSVYDGDTFKAKIPNWPSIVGEKISIRIDGIDAPEIKDKRADIAELAEKARIRLSELLSTGKIVLREIQRDKYFRLRCKVEVDGKDISEILLEEQLVKAYHGLGPRPW